MIDSFDGEYRFLSNFYSSKIKYEGIEYPTVEHAFQAAKSLDENIRQSIAALPTPGAAKKAGRRSVVLRGDWEQVKISVMKELVSRKFEMPEFRDKLFDTDDEELVEGNTWNDTFWGVCNGKGRNELGKILMEIRDKENRAIDSLISFAIRSLSEKEITDSEIKEFLSKDVKLSKEDEEALNRIDIMKAINDYKRRTV